MSSLVRSKKPVYDLGQSIVKFFPGHGDFKGTVTSLPTADFPFYSIDYEDGDSEHMAADQLSKYIAQDARSKPQKKAALSSLSPNSGAKRKGVADDDEVESPPSKRPTRTSFRAARPSRAAARKMLASSPVVTKSGRVIKSTTVNVGGYAVKNGNNYDVGAESYIYSEKPSAKKKVVAGKKGGGKKSGASTATKVKSSTKKKEGGAKRLASTAERKRAAHNEEVKEREDTAVALRRDFFAKNIGIINKFVDPKLADALVSEKKEKARASEPESEEEYMQPDLIEGELRDYQLAGLNWMISMFRRGMPMILGDEMGLGKTLQTISLICHLKETEKRTGPSLVICPLSVLESWVAEVGKWAPDLSVLRLHASAKGLGEMIKNKMANAGKGGFLSYDIIVTTYDIVKSTRSHSVWSRLRFNLVVLDEGHIIKNHASLIAQGVRRIHSESKLLLSGTPLQNNLVELWSILSYLYPSYFADVSHKIFASAFDIAQNHVDTELLHSAHGMLRLFMLRRMKTEVEKLMPRKVETRVQCPLSEMQIQLYKGLLLNDINLLVQASEQNQDATIAGAASKPQPKTYKCLVAIFTQLRKLCNHPYNIAGVEGDIESTTVEDLIAASGKLAVLDKLLRSLFVGCHRVVLFSQFTANLDLIQDYCNMRGFRNCRFDGGTQRAKRNHIVKQFNAPDSDIFIFLMSTRAGGMGLNLQTADTCILFDSDYNPQSDLQAMARVHRIGQTKTVHVYRLVSAGTIEERNVERAQKKLYLGQVVNRDSSPSEKESTGLSTSEMLDALTFGSDAVFDSNSELNCLPSDEDIRHITDRSRNEDDSFGNLKGGATRKVGDFDCEAKLTATSKLGGIDFAAIREAHWNSGGRRQSEGGLIAAAQELGKRQRKARIMMVKDDDGEEIPVLNSNNYDLEAGESSVFARELSGRGGDFAEQKRVLERAGEHFDSSTLCQICGENGSLTSCPICPVASHAACLQKYCAEHDCNLQRGFLPNICPHHACVSCNRSRSAAGGILYPCQACLNSFCEDCCPEEAIVIGPCSRFEELGFDSTKHSSYIICSKKCEEFAKSAFNWSPKDKKTSTLPPEIDVSYAFGKKVDAEVPSVPVGSNQQAADAPAADERIFKVGDVVDVKARSNNKRGGRGRIAKAENVKYEGMLYDVIYVMGGKEERVPCVYVTAVTDGEARKPRQIKKVTYHDMQPWSPSPAKKKAQKEMQAKSIGTTGTRPACSEAVSPPVITVPLWPQKGHYDVSLALSADGALPIALQNKEAPVKFGGYKKIGDSKGPTRPAGFSGVFRNVGDTIVAIGGRSVVGFPRREVKRIMRKRAAEGIGGSSVLIRLQDSRQEKDDLLRQKEASDIRSFLEAKPKPAQAPGDAISEAPAVVFETSKPARISDISDAAGGKLDECTPAAESSRDPIRYENDAQNQCGSSKPVRVSDISSDKVQTEPTPPVIDLTHSSDSFGSSSDVICID